MLTLENNKDEMALETAKETHPDLLLTDSIFGDRIILESIMAEEKRSILNKALEKAHHIVFNKMPIRMLVFSAGGTNIKLVERPEIFRHVSSRINDAVD